jgi:hypothetical protein
VVDDDDEEEEEEEDVAGCFENNVLGIANVTVYANADAENVAAAAAGWTATDR